MKRRKVDTLKEQRILTGMIMSDEVIAGIFPMFNADYFEIPYAKLIAEWCVDYYRKYDRAPGEDIEGIFLSRQDSLEDGLKHNIASFISALSTRYEDEIIQVNPDTILSEAEEIFRVRSLALFEEELEEARRRKDFKQVNLLLEEFSLPSADSAPPIPLHINEDKIRAAFEEVDKPLFKYPGKLGELMNPHFVRSSFLSLLAPEKRGKTWFLIDLAHKALIQRNNVAFFEAGDMSEKQITARFCVHASGKNFKKRYCGEQLELVPDCLYNQDGSCTLIEPDEIEWQGTKKEMFEMYKDHVPCNECLFTGKQERYVPIPWYRECKRKRLRDEEAVHVMKRLQRRAGRKLMLSSHQADSLDVQGIRQQLNIWKREIGFVPDVLIIDYIDIMAPEPGFETQFRHKINQTWKRIRALSQELDCCIITATQADIAGAENRSLGLSNFSEDKRKRSHITAEFGLNQTLEEKQRGMMRVNEILVREEASSFYEARIFCDLGIGRPVIQKFKKML